MKTALSVAEVQRLLDTVPFSSEFHFDVEELGDGEATLAVPYQVRHQRPGGILSGQVYMCAADVAMWVAILTRLGIEDRSVTSSLQTAFLGSAREEKIRCRARVLKLGRRLIYGLAECSGADGRLLTHHAITYARPA